MKILRRILARLVREVLREKKRTTEDSFDFSNYTTVTIPTVSFAFGGGVKIDLIPLGILISVCSTVACLAFAGNGDATDTGIFGNTQQLTFEVVYDVVGGKLGFGAAGC
ncbi:hypothetical protein SASPL_110980 [Salvia splendens]|uniref:Peptidase A1 domain-containing protein n=1 Tax=Salvia splendens TaxID=180675 RepID=A0A8X9A2X8_SALSN|nr:hypothetical protein SASPL_110980 [Salvia splendens]